ncbi:MAG: hypothetical protein PHU33_17230 [Bacteroidales bacterium]|nr:hypothetical protein [Bacteroidales bacterium]
MVKQSNRYSHGNEILFRRRKRWFWVFLATGMLAILFLFLVYPFLKPEAKRAPIRVGICGAVHIPAVYTMFDGADLAMLIRRANGLEPGADISEVNLDEVLMNDTIYHIPARGPAQPAETDLNRELQKVFAKAYTNLSNEVSKEFNQKDIRQINVLYVGFPAVYMLINYYPDFHRISVTHIPHTARFINNDYRLIDVFFTTGIEATKKILENSLMTRIDYYLIQDRFSFIDFVNLVDGLDLNLDGPYAEYYKLQPGPSHLDGFYTWEFIRFLDFKRIGVKYTPGSKVDVIRTDNFYADAKAWELAYEQRNHRQRTVIAALRRAFAKQDKSQQADIIQKIIKTFETNLSAQLLLDVYQDVLSTPDFTYGNLPGYYGTNSKNQLFFYPDIPSFELLRKEEIRNILLRAGKKPQTVY